MEVTLTGKVSDAAIGRINPKELTPETYIHYCRLFLTERVFEVIPQGSTTNYGHISKLINCIDPILFKNLNLETNKVLLLNKIYALFMEATEEQLSREYLYNKITQLASYDPALYQ